VFYLYCCSQIWLNLRRDDCHFLYIFQVPMNGRHSSYKQKCPKKKKTLVSTHLWTFVSLRYCRSIWFADACSVLGAICPITNLKPVSCHAPYFADLFCRRDVVICCHHLFKPTGISGEDKSASESLPRYPHLGIRSRNFWQIDGWCPDKKLAPVIHTFLL